MDQDVGYLFPELLAKHRYAVIALQTIVTTSTTPKTAPATERVDKSCSIEAEEPAEELGAPYGLPMAGMTHESATKCAPLMPNGFPPYDGLELAE